MSSHPWSRAARQALLMGKKKFKPPVKPLARWDIVKGDQVTVVGGHKDAGKEGKVLEVIRKKNLVLVEGVNLRQKRFAPTEEQPNGVFTQMPVPFPVEKVALIDPTDQLPCEITYKKNSEGEPERVSTRSGSIIPKPFWRRKDFEVRAEYKDSVFDTSADVVAKVTYNPSVLSFEENVLRGMENGNQ
eukprot:m.38342 g.38342  ORF g.38342 m.38342 type:complete len:187 (-) comp6792_c0_seq1:1876-2436(-)